MLRHPHTRVTEQTDERCGKEDFFNKDYMLATFNFEIFPPVTIETRFYLFDLGASLYNKGAGGASMAWFVDTYEKRGIKFDRILAWEMTQHSPESIFQSFPKYPYEVMSYFNIPAVTGREDHVNPLNILKSITKNLDFVVIKIDIDNEMVEEQFLQQILEDDDISSRIDELYFEHHVGKHPMEYPYWGDSTPNPRQNITQSFQLFESLRKKGIRAHSWV